MAVIYSKARKPARASVTVKEKTRKAKVDAERNGAMDDAPAPREKKGRKDGKNEK